MAASDADAAYFLNLNLENIVIAGCIVYLCEDWIMSDLWRIIIHPKTFPYFFWLLSFFGLVCLLNKSSSSHFFALFFHLLHISTICSILVKLNWSQSIGTEIRKRHLNGIMTAHDIFFDCSCKNFNRMSFPLWFMECFPFCLLLFMLKIFFETVSVFGSFLSQLLLLPSYV